LVGCAKQILEGMEAADTSNDVRMVASIVSEVNGVALGLRVAGRPLRERARTNLTRNQPTLWEVIEV
jgi:hypothetical protein